MADNIKLLDCTLRDGGYINDWNFGHENIVNIFERLVGAGVDIIETGFLDERRPFDFNRSIVPDMKSMNKLLQGLDHGKSMIVGMIDYGTCGIENLLPAKESCLDGIRVIFKKHHMMEALMFCKKIKELGYAVFVQAVSITSYNEEEYHALLEEVNEVEPYAFSMVDTYGLLHKKQLQSYFDRANEQLKPDICLGYHSHNNFQLAYANCIELLQEKIERTLVVDGTLYGMGKSAGNAPIELLATYMNENCGKAYHKSQLLEAIDVTILDIYRTSPWGYQFKFFLSASNDCHPNYVSYLMDKKKLSVKSINEILESLDEEKKLLYDEDYIEKLYVEYQKDICNDYNDLEGLKDVFADKEILLLAPGHSVYTDYNKIIAYIRVKNPVVVSVNFCPDGYPLDFIFMSNAKRYVRLSSVLANLPKQIKTIATSNVTKAKGDFDYMLNYSAWLDEEALIVDNPMLMFLKVLKQIGTQHVTLAGFDGYTTSETEDYVNPNMAYSFSKEKAMDINEDVKKGLEKLDWKGHYTFLTESLYDVIGS